MPKRPRTNDQNFDPRPTKKRRRRKPLTEEQLCVQQCLEDCYDCFPAHEQQYDVIYADPPWKYDNSGNKGACEYHTTKTSDLCEIPVKHITKENAVLFMWATWPKLQDALDLIKAWGFSYKTCWKVWLKRSKTGKKMMGCGYYVRSSVEPLLVAIKGKPLSTLLTKARYVERQELESLRRRHSEKPPETIDMINAYVAPDAKKIELFARKQWSGWDAWGLETEGYFHDSIKIENQLQTQNTDK